VGDCCQTRPICGQDSAIATTLALAGWQNRPKLARKWDPLAILEDKFMKEFKVRFSSDGSSRILEKVILARDGTRARKQVKDDYPDSHIYSVSEL